VPLRIPIFWTLFFDRTSTRNDFFRANKGRHHHWRCASRQQASSPREGPLLKLLGELVFEVMRRPCRRSLAGSVIIGATLLAGVSRYADALAFSSVSSRLQSRSISRALISRKLLPGRPQGVSSRSSQTHLSSTAAPERVSTETKPITTTTTQEAIPNNMLDALNRFFLGPDRGPISVVGMLSFLSTWRLFLPFTSLDLAAFGGMALFWCFQEHIIHEKLLHSEQDWMGKEIHHNHHLKPYFNISIDPAWLMIAWLATAHVVFRLLFPLPLALSATLGYASAGLFYEWSHYIVHTRVKPPNAFWKRVRDNHIRHHLVDDRYWLSFTLPIVDDIFGTNPSVEDVKREQARGGPGGQSRTRSSATRRLIE